MTIEILTNRSQFQSAIAEVRNEWLFNLLQYLEIDLAPFQNKEQDLPKLADTLFQNKIEVIDYPSLGAVKVLYHNEVVGEWAGPEFKLKVDENGELYYEIQIECWSIIEELSEES